MSWFYGWFLLVKFIHPIASWSLFYGFDEHLNSTAKKTFNDKFENCMQINIFFKWSEKKQQQNIALQVKQIIRPVKMAIENIHLFFCNYM